MKSMINRVLAAAVVSAVTLVGSSAPASAQTQDEQKVDREQRRAERQQKRAARQQQQRDSQQKVERAAPVQTQTDTQRAPINADEQVIERPTTTQRAVPMPRTTVQPQTRTVQPQPRTVQPRTDITVGSQPRVVQVQPRVIRQQRAERRLDQRTQEQQIARQRQRLQTWRTRYNQQQQLLAQRTAQLENQRRLNQYRYQQDYLNRLRQQQYYWNNYNNYNYYNDPFFSTASSYRFYVGGSPYMTNYYGAQLLEQAVEYGYQEGYYAGRADREDRWRFNFGDSYVYQDANFGYSGFYVDQSAYNYYFRQGFQRGYEDGYYSRNRYGSYSNGTAQILAGVLGTILQFALDND